MVALLYTTGSTAAAYREVSEHVLSQLENPTIQEGDTTFHYYNAYPTKEDAKYAAKKFKRQFPTGYCKQYGIKTRVREI